MTPTTPPAANPYREEARAILRRPYHPVRRLLDRGFVVVAFAATFFGLAMLIVFLGCLGYGAYEWFKVVPDLIEKRNAAVAESARQARDQQAYVAAELAKVDKEMAEELELAGGEQEKAKIRKDYEGIKERKRTHLTQTAKELTAGGSQDQRNDVRPVALLGHFLTQPTSSQPQDAGIRAALLGSIFITLITMAIAVPLGVGAAVYLEEYKTQDWTTRLIQINISNLAGVPSVVYGILGAFVFVELLFKPMEPAIAARNLLGGGMTLALLTLPVIIVGAQEAIRAVPVSLRHGAMALGATRWQVVAHHVLPQAFPGILTGVILALARAIGEAAPLVMFGATLFVDQDPTLFSRFTVLPMQIFDWTGRPEAIWRYNAALASLVLMVALLGINGVAIYLRQRAQRAQRGLR